VQKGIKRRQFLRKSGEFSPIFAKKACIFAKNPFIFRNFSQFFSLNSAQKYADTAVKSDKTVSV